MLLKSSLILLLKSSLILLLVASGTACERRTTPEGISPATSKQMQGLSVIQPSGKRIIFLGYRKNILEQLKDSLARKKTDETWYRVELPDNYMPRTTEALSFDLKQTQNIHVIMRMLWPDSQGGAFYGTTEFHSMGRGIKGEVKLLGNTNLKDLIGTLKAGVKLGIKMAFEYDGDLVVNGVPFNGRHTFNIGGLFAVVQ